MIVYAGKPGEKVKTYRQLARILCNLLNKEPDTWDARKEHVWLILS